MTKTTIALGATAIAALAACSSSDDNSGGNGSDTGPAYVVSSLVFTPEGGRTAYVSVLDSLQPQEIDYKKAREYSGAADTWVYGGMVYVSDNEKQTVTKFAVRGGALVEQGRISFGAYGFSDVGLWSNDFVSPTKAYMMNFKAREYVVWNPTTMTVTTTVRLPELEQRPGFIIDLGLADRSTEIRGGRLYQPIYWTDESYHNFTQDSRIAVIDVENDTFVKYIEAGCPDLDHGTQDDAGNLYFSNWQSAAVVHLVKKSPASCVVKIPAGKDEAEAAFTFASIADGHEGSALRYVGNGRMIFSAFDETRVTYDETTDPEPLIGSANWRIWSYDMATGKAAPLEGIDWNSGSFYAFEIDGRMHLLSPSAEWTGSTVYDLGDPSKPVELFKTRGWSLRLFKVR
ncbi:hypothetical protein LVJ94_06735 [Pendulispora rubella]|uniref:Uncharacterized protein n=1 Tax=Pendulispora rubella TaxID=2741070 RepID=A0ABZ2LAX0_9BACT